MTRCPEIQELLSPYLDAEATLAERAAVEGHLERCETCRDALASLERLRGELADHFVAENLHAPPPPDSLKARLDRVSRQRKVRSLMLKTVSAIGLAAAALVLVTLYPGESLDANANELVERATRKYLELEDVELLVTLRSEVVAALEKIFGDDDSDLREKLPPFRVFAKARGQVLIDPGSDDDAIRLRDDLAGISGGKVWCYDADRDTVTLSPTPRFDLADSELDFDQDDLLRFVSWSFIQRLHDEGDRLEIRETTGHFERRIERRKFELTLRNLPAAPGGKPKKKSRFFWTRVEIIIDPRENLIEKFVFDVALTGLSLFGLEVELVRVNQELPDAFFDYRTYVSPTTSVVEKDEVMERR